MMPGKARMAISTSWSAPNAMSWSAGQVARDAGDDLGKMDRGRGVMDEVDQNAEIDGGERERHRHRQVRHERAADGEHHADDGDDRTGQRGHSSTAATLSTAGISHRLVRSVSSRHSDSMANFLSRMSLTCVKDTGWSATGRDRVYGGPHNPSTIVLGNCRKKLAASRRHAGTGAIYGNKVYCPKPFWSMLGQRVFDR
jgi:hypothetical protein